jgi:hypothetical protein
MDLGYVNHLQSKFAKCVGYLPKVALEWYCNTGRVNLALENGEPAGYLLTRELLAWQPLLRPIFQTAVAMDAQRRHHGLKLLLEVERLALAAGQIGIQANCAVGLEANDFWRTAGFVPICHLSPKNKRNRELICWRKPLTRKLPSWFAMPPRRAGYLARPAVVARNPLRDEIARQESIRLTLGDSSAIRARFSSGRHAKARETHQRASVPEITGPDGPVLLVRDPASLIV